MDNFLLTASLNTHSLPATLTPQTRLRIWEEAADAYYIEALYFVVWWRLSFDAYPKPNPKTLFLNFMPATGEKAL